MIEFKELLEYCQAEAIATRMAPTELSVWRGICRTYSEKFHTPLAQVLEMDPEHVILNVYESQAEDMDIEDYQKLEHILDTLKGMEDPDYDAKKAKEQEEFDRQAELEEEERVKSGKAVHPSLQKKLDAKRLLEKGEPEPPKKPTGGMVNLDYLSKIDSQE
ncbi:MAG: hypothetical protein HC840_00395 [Leptolyngbyaceae cyanobacterium RM2_2_4]|nr:hypothetical protein [Leptolyngbyaceae cyanobacterium RM2_2_4]